MKSKPMIDKITLKEKFDLFNEHWSPKIIGELNGQHVKLVKAQGEFDWHSHENEDELFMVIEGDFEMHLRDKIIEVNKGELIIIPKGVEHKPDAKNEVQLLLFEPKSTLNTGSNETSELKKENLDWI